MRCPSCGAALERHELRWSEPFPCSVCRQILCVSSDLQAWVYSFPLSVSIIAVMVLRQYFPVGIDLTCLEGILLYSLGLVAMKRFYKLTLEIYEPELITLNLSQGNTEAKRPN